MCDAVPQPKRLLRAAVGCATGAAVWLGAVAGVPSPVAAQTAAGKPADEKVRPHRKRPRKRDRSGDGRPLPRLILDLDNLPTDSRAWDSRPRIVIPRPDASKILRPRDSTFCQRFRYTAECAR